MDAQALLASLRSRGFRLEVASGGVLRLTPAARLSWSDRAAIRAGKDELVKCLEPVGVEKAEEAHAVAEEPPGELDVRSPEFQRRVEAVFGRKLTYGDGPVEFDAFSNPLTKPPRSDGEGPVCESCESSQRRVDSKKR